MKFSFQPVFHTLLFASTGALLQFSCAQAAPTGAQNDAPALRLGQQITIEGKPYYFLGKDKNGMVLSPPLAPTASLGAFITPVAAEASTVQSAARDAMRLIDGSGLDEYWPGSGVYVHSNNPYADGSSMWNGSSANNTGIVSFDLGKSHNVSGLYLWNFNESGQWLGRGVQDFDLTASGDGQTYQPVGAFKLPKASGDKDYKGEAVAFQTPVKARYFRMNIKSNYGASGVGLSEVRFANADVPYQPPQPFQPKYPRPTHPKLALGAPLKGGENIVFPADFGHADVTDAKYGAKGDGITDDTAAIQKALSENQGGIVYLPNGRYLVSDTLKWPGSNPTGRRDYKYTALQGQSRGGTIIQLKDNAPGYDNPRNAKPVIWTGPAPAQRFANEVMNLTIDTGVGNLGASGLHFNSNNTGTVEDVAVVSGDGQGVAGIDFGFTDEIGPLLARNIKVVGFDVGISAAFGVNSQTLENIEVENQNVAGLRDAGQVWSVRNLVSRNSVPALQIVSGLVALDGATLTGTGEATNGAAINNGAALWARDVKASGYASAIRNNAGDKESPAGLSVAQFQTPAPKTLFAGGAPLRLPVQETPEATWDDPKTWVSVKSYMKPGLSDSDAMQAAIDSGATTIYFPRGGYKFSKTVVIRGKVRRIIGAKAWLNNDPAFHNSNAPMFRLEDGEAPLVIMERLNTDFSDGNLRFLDHDSARGLALKQVAINLHAGTTAYRASGKGGALWLEDVVGPKFEFKNQNVWARQLNAEIRGTHVVNDGAKVWILGLKTERRGVIVETVNGGQSEIFGGLVYNIGNDGSPMFTVSDGQLAATVAEAHFSDSSYTKFVVETQGGQTKELPGAAGFKGQRVIVYQSGTK